MKRRSFLFNSCLFIDFRQGCGSVQHVCDAFIHTNLGTSLHGGYEGAGTLFILLFVQCQGWNVCKGTRVKKKKKLIKQRFTVLQLRSKLHRISVTLLCCFIDQNGILLITHNFTGFDTEAITSQPHTYVYTVYISDLKQQTKHFFSFRHSIFCQIN